MEREPVYKTLYYKRGLIGQSLDNHGCSYMNDQLVIHYNDSHLSHWQHGNFNFPISKNS